MGKGAVAHPSESSPNPRLESPEGSMLMRSEDISDGFLVKMWQLSDLPENPPKYLWIDFNQW